MTAALNVEAITATTTDGVTLRGEVVRGDGTWAVLVHDVGEDIDVWQGLRRGLASRGWSVLALDLRGHGGSEGPDPWAPENADLDVELAVALARRFGARHVTVVASGRGGILALRAVERALADEQRDLADTLILVSPGPLEGADPMSLRGAGLSKLFLYGAQDASAGDALALRRASIGWTVEATFATDARSGRLLEEWAPNVLDKARGFVHEQSALGGPGSARFERRLASAKEET